MGEKINKKTTFSRVNGIKNEMFWDKTEAKEC